MTLSEKTLQRKLQAFINATEIGDLIGIGRQLAWLETQDDDRIRECCLQVIHTLIEHHGLPDIMVDILHSKLFKTKRGHEMFVSEIPHFVKTATMACQSLHQLGDFLLTLVNAIDDKMENDMDILNLLDSNGWSALHLVAKDGDSKALRYLLELGQNCLQTTPDGNTALSLAIALQHSDLVSILLPLSDVNSSDIDGDTPLMYASWRRQPSIVSELIKSGANVNAQSAHGATALWNAVYRSCPQTVLILLQHNAKMDVMTEGTRPFRRSDDDDDGAKRDSEQVVKIYRGHRRSLLWVAVDRIKGLQTYDKSTHILLMLLEAGYDVTKEKWLNHISGNVPKKYPKGFMGYDVLRDVLYFFHTRPRKLKDICRSFLRNYHARNRQDSLSDWLSGLSVGENVISFLTLNYILSEDI